MKRFTTVILLCLGLLITGCGGGGGGSSAGGTTSGGTVGYEVDWTDGANHTWGTICNGRGQPFTLNFTSGSSISGTFAFSPDSTNVGGTVKETGSETNMPAGSSLTYSGEGGYSFLDPDNSLYFIIPEQTGTLCTPLGCQAITLPGISNTLELLPTSKCG